MYILGLNIGHNATACLLKDGKIVCCTSEERFSRIKNHYGIPFKSISFLLEEHRISLSDIDSITLDDHYFPDADPYFGKRYLEAYTKKSKKNKILSYLGYKFPGAFQLYSNYKDSSIASEHGSKIKNLKEIMSSALKFPKDKIQIIDHHRAHALSTCFNLPKNRKTLVFTLDGEGSGISASVSIFDGEKMKTLSRSKKSASIGYLYSAATVHLGMKPLEHEFKVMGLAPYAKENSINKIYPIFEKLIWLEGLEFKSSFNMPFADHFFRKEMKFSRFDIISGAVQKLTEDLVIKWVTKAIQKTGIRDIAVTGGVFMNVKANLKVSEIPEVSTMFIMPSSGDESNPIGCCYYSYQGLCKKNNIKFKPEPLKGLYLGPEYSDEYIENLIKEKNLKSKYEITKPKNINKEAAKLLAKGHIVSRCSGKSEWGARALGNRSILSNPKHPDTIRILNEAIKDRDFWMPFTPSMLDKYENKYLLNQKKIPADYMVLTFNSTEKAQNDLPAAMHPYDFTVRPQILRKEYNKDYYELIEEFSKLTGTGAILNTSFNLHGEPNVLTPEDALRTVENSALNYLVLGSYLLRKK